MPGTSRMPVSLRESFNNVRRRSRAGWNPSLMLNLDLSVAAHLSLPLALIMMYYAAHLPVPPTWRASASHLLTTEGETANFSSICLFDMMDTNTPII